MKVNYAKSKFRGVCLVVTILVLLVGLMLNPAELRAQYGRITGRVTEAETGTELPGANVMLMGTTIGDATDADGRYLLTRVPTGTYNLQVSYLGYETQTAEVKVERGLTLTQNFSLTGIALTAEEIIVLGVRAKGQARALNQQMNAINIKNIVASDQMGRFPDSNAPEAVQRIPGVAVQRDMGEGRYILIRGGAPQMTQVTFNGERVPSPEGSIRQIALDAVPVDILESIEVSKAITPDMDAESIGGAVELVTKRAPDKPMFSVEGAGGYSSIRENLAGSGSVTYGNRITDGRFGYLLSGSWSRRDFGSDDLEPEYEINDPGLDDDQLDELQVRHYSLFRQRQGATAMLDYRLKENSSLFLSGVYSELIDDEQRRRFRHRPGKGDYQPDGSVTDARIVLQHKTRQEKLRTINITAGGDHVLQRGLELDYHLTVAHSQEDTPRDTEIEFVQKGVTFKPDISDPDNIRANPQGGAIEGKYKFDNIEPASSLTTNRDIVAALNLTFPYRFGSQAVGKFKIGGKFRDKNKDQDVTENAFELTDDAEDIILGQGIGIPFSNVGYNPGNYPYPSIVTSEQDVLDFVKNNRSSLEGGHVTEEDVGDFDVTERTMALYAMTEINFTPKFMLLPGVRFERTTLDAESWEYDNETDTVSPKKDEGSYNKFFPMVHVRYRVTPRTNIRAAFTTALSRPNFGDLVPFVIRDDEDRILGNPELKPTTSLNLDLIFEHYDRLIGVISAGVFYKRITDPIFVFSEDNEFGGITSQPRNGEAGNIRGIEVALQRQLRFLPKPFDGLGIYGNYTYTTSEATLAGGRKTPLPGQADHVFNAALSYEKGGFSSQISLNYHDDYIEEFGGDIGGAASFREREEDVFIDRHLQLDLTASYQFRPNFAVFMELVNITNEPFQLYQSTRKRPRQMEYYETWGRFGLRFRM
ncbi:MAG: TonB-dependent receptor [bacterium]